MRKTTKVLSIICTCILFCTSLIPSAFAKDFAPKFDTTNLGVQTQYAYSEADVSWIRKLAVKEDMLTPQGIATEAVLHPVTNYPYITDAEHFKAEVDECTKSYTLDEESQKAAYFYLLEQIGALTIISEPTVSNETKADWLRSRGIIVTDEDEKDAERVLLISALYAMMRNDLYYVYTGNHYEIPSGTPLEEALVMYIIALTGRDNSLTAFMIKFFGKNSIGSLEDYMYYTSLMALYTNGYVSAREVSKLDRKEVYRRVAIMTIKSYGLSIDAENASAEELQQKYLTAMLGSQYKVSLDPESLVKSKSNQGVAYYILQRMAKEDSNITINNKKYSYKECFNIVLKKTKRFNLEKEFYSDIYEYNVYLESNRKNISICPTPLTSGAGVTINNKQVAAGEYATVSLKNTEVQTVNIVCTYTVNKKSTSSTYKINVHQGTKPASGSNITNIIPTYSSGGLDITGPSGAPLVSAFNQAGANLLGNVLTLNEKGQLVDQYGNIVGAGNYSVLPEGYKYVLGDDGIIQVVFAGEDATDSDKSDADKVDDAKKIIIIISLSLCIALIIALIATAIYMKKRGKTSDADKMKKRKEKEKAKKEKLQAKAEKKKKKQ